MNKTILDDRHHSPPPIATTRHHLTLLGSIAAERSTGGISCPFIGVLGGASRPELGHFSPWSCGNPGKSWLKEKKHRKISVEI